MVDVGLVSGRRLHDEYIRVWLECDRLVGPSLGDFRKVAHQIDELLTIGEQVGEPRGHERRRAHDLFLDCRLGNRGFAGTAGHLAEHDILFGFSGHDAGETLAVVGDDRDAAIGRPYRGRGIQQRFYQVGHEPLPGHALRHRSDVWPQRRFPLARDVALRAGEVPRVKEIRSPPSVAGVYNLVDECGTILGDQQIGEARSRLRSGNLCRSCHGQPSGDREQAMRRG